MRHTSNDPAYLTDNVSSYDGAARYETSPKALIDNRIITAPGTGSVSFAAAVFEAAGMDAETAKQFRTMTAAEHG